MKTFKRLYLIFVLFFLVSIKLWSKTSSSYGLDLCNWMYNFLINKGFYPEKIQLLSNTSNEFPYGLSINIDQKNNDNSHNLIFCISIEEAYKNQDIVNNLITDLKYRNFSSSIYFAYSSTDKIPRVQTIDGIEHYLNTINTSKTSSACILRLNKQENTIITNSMRYCSPSWMVNNAYDSFLSNDMGENLPVYYLSQLSKFFYNSEDFFTSFAKQNIPTIGFSFNSQTTNHETISNLLTKYIDLYETTQNKETDFHSLIIKIGKSKIFLSEYTIIKIVIISIILSLLFFYVLFFINSNIKNDAWKEIRKDWFSIPITLIITIISFYIAKTIYLNNINFESDYTPYGLCVFQILLSSALISVFYWFEVSVRKKTYSERSIDFLILIVTFINQFIFCIADISLFPLFMVVCILSILSFNLKKNWFHIVLFAFMILIYIPFVLIIYKTSTPQSIRLFVSMSNVYIFILTLILLPIYLMLFRILTAIRQRISKKRYFAIIISSTYVLFFVLLMSLNYTIFNKKENELIFAKVQTSTQNSDENIKADFLSQNIFDEQINILNIETPLQADVVIVKVTGNTIIPVLYSDEEFIINNTKSVTFKIPPYPPNKMKFRFCSIKSNFTIEIEAIYKKPNSDEYISYKKEINSKDFLINNKEQIQTY